MPARGPLDLAPLEAELEEYGVRIGARRIEPGDEAAFSGARPQARIEVHRASGSARIAARGLLAALGSEPTAQLVRSESGAPLWPRGFIGSLAHDQAFAVAAVARRGRLIGLGVDVEPAEPLPEDVVDLVLTERERRLTQGDGVARRLVFVAKEAVYKAVHPLDGTPLDFPDVEIGLVEKTAWLGDGRRLRLLPFAGGRLVVVAMVEAARLPG